jgi:AcrR family transcriptional regulator
MKEIQEQRMKRYFIDSAKAILKSEGIKAFSARTVAEGAGFSYATIYNYFKDMKELITICVSEFIAECEEFVLTRNHVEVNGLEKLISVGKAYLNYFVQYTSVFDVVFIEKISELRYQEDIQKNLNLLFDKIFASDFEEIGRSNSIEKNDLDNLKELFKLTLNSLLLFYINRWTPKDYKEFIVYSEKSLNFIFVKWID